MPSASGAEARVAGEVEAKEGKNVLSRRSFDPSGDLRVGSDHAVLGLLLLSGGLYNTHSTSGYSTDSTFISLERCTSPSRCADHLSRISSPDPNTRPRLQTSWLEQGHQGISQFSIGVICLFWPSCLTFAFCCVFSPRPSNRPCVWRHAFEPGPSERTGGYV